VIAADEGRVIEHDIFLENNMWLLLLGSCRIWDELCLNESDPSVNLNISSFRKSSSYFIRVFSQAPGYRNVFADQEIIMTDRRIPAMVLRSVRNSCMELLHSQ